MLIIITPTSGELSLSDMQKELIRNELLRNEGKEVQLSVERYKHPRTSKANRYLFGVVYKAISEETGHTVNELHDFFKRLFLPPSFMRIGSKEERVAGSTAELDVKEFGEYIDRIIAFAGTELSISIPPAQS